MLRKEVYVTYTFIGILHFRGSAKEYQLDANTFYKAFRGEKPRGRGYEIVVGNNEQILDWHNKERKYLNKDGNPSELHIHTGNDKKPYVCYPPAISTKEEAEDIFDMWARITFGEIFFGFSDEKLAKATGTGEIKDWDEHLRKYFEKNGVTFTSITKK